MSRLKALYSPYGAFELKSKYQTNFLKALITVSGFLLLLLIIINNYSNTVYNGIITLKPEPFKLIPIDIKRPAPVKPSVIFGNYYYKFINLPFGVPHPIEDNLIDEGLMSVTSKDFEKVDQILHIPGDSIAGLIIDLESVYISNKKGFKSIEVLPEMIYYESPNYPRFAVEAGNTGDVWIMALIDKKGNVIEARVNKSSSFADLDRAALDAAYANKYKPAIQNGIPFMLWVKYKVEFRIRYIQTEE